MSTTTPDAVTLPRPRSAETTTAGPGRLGPWPEPWRHAPGARPSSDYWDVTSATWRTRLPVPSPRAGTEAGHGG